MMTLRDLYLSCRDRVDAAADSLAGLAMTEAVQIAPSVMRDHRTIDKNMGIIRELWRIVDEGAK